MASRTRLSSNGFWFDAMVTGWNDGLLTSTRETAGVTLERRDEGHRHLEDHLYVSTRQRRDLRGRLGQVHLPELVEVGLAGVPVVGVLDHARAVARPVLGQPERPRPRRLGRDLVGPV